VNLIVIVNLSIVANYIYIYIYILFAVNPKRNAKTDRYRNIPFQWPNRNGCRNGIYNIDLYAQRGKIIKEGGIIKLNQGEFS
jgi:hypothetical protein